MNAPVFAADLVTATITENVSVISGTITTAFQQVNFTDAGTGLAGPGGSGEFHGINVTPLSGAIGTLNAAIIDDATGGADPTGYIQWNYTVDNSLLEYLSAGETRVVQFAVDIVDSDGQSDTLTVSITITGSNDAPLFAVASTSAPSMSEDGALSASGTLNFTDLDVSDTHVVSNIAVSASGTGVNAATPGNAALLAMFNTSNLVSTASAAGGSFDYAFTGSNAAFQYLKAGETLTLTYTITLADAFNSLASGGSATATVTVTITGSNDAPVLSVGNATITDTAGDDTYATLTGTFTRSDADFGDSDFYSVQDGTVSSFGSYDIEKATAYGTFYLNSANGDYSFVPNDAAIEGLKAPVTLTLPITVTDGSGGTDVKNFVITINGVNDTAVITGASSGTIGEAGGALNGTPGTPAMLIGDLNHTDRDAADLDDDWTAATLTGNYGTLSIGTDGQWSYALNQSNSDVQGLKLAADTLTDTFTVFSVDGTSQVITVTITGANDAAVITGTATGNVTEAGGVNNATNPTPTATGNLNHTDVDTADVDDAWTAETIAGQYGSLTINAAGVWTYTLDNGIGAVKELDDLGTLTDTITVTTSDGTPKNIVITIAGTNDAPVVSAIAPASVAEAAGNVAAQDISLSGSIAVTDEDASDMLSAGTSAATVAYSGPGTLPSGLATLLGAQARLAFGADVSSGSGAARSISWTYTGDDIDLNFLGAGETITITYDVAVGDGSTATTRPLVITITGTNDVPTVSGVVSAGITEDTATPFTLDLLANASDRDQNYDLDLGPTMGLNVTGGTWLPRVDFSVNNETGVLSIDPNQFNTLSAGETVEVTFAYNIFDDQGAFVPATAVITITGQNDAPVVTGAVTATVNEDATNPATIDLLANSSDVDRADDLDVTVTSVSVTGGTWSNPLVYNVNSETGLLTFNPAQFNSLGHGESITITVVYGVTDGPATTNTSATITITGTNDLPVLSPVSYDVVGSNTVAEDTDARAQNLSAIAGTLSVTDADRADTLIASASTAEVTLNSAPFSLPGSAASLLSGLSFTGTPGSGSGATQTINWTYDPAAADLDFLKDGDTLVITFPVTVSDGHGSSNTQNITITITGTNDVPTIAANTTGGVTEAGGTANGTAGTPTVTGDVSLGGTNWTDLDRGEEATLAITKGSAGASSQASLTFNGGTGDEAVITGTYGTLYIKANGEYRYVLNNSSTATQALDGGDTPTDVFHYTIGGSGAGSATADIIITVTGSNDNPVLATVTQPSAVTEAGNAAAQSVSLSGVLSVTDADANDTLTASATTAVVELNGNAFTLPPVRPRCCPASPSARPIRTAARRKA